MNTTSDFLPLDQLLEMRFVEERKKITGSASVPDITPTVAMICLGLHGLASSPITDLDEESITAGLVARFASEFRWCHTALAHKRGLSSGMLWGQYSKTAKNPNTSETKRGADFLLAIPLSEKEIRVALFQAKKCEYAQDPKDKKQGVECVDIYRKGSETDNRDQLTKLRATADFLSREVTGTTSRKWVHYILWPKPGRMPKSLSIDKLDTVGKLTSRYRIVTEAFEACAELLFRGARASSPDDDRDAAIPDGWLEMTMADAVLHLPKMLSLTHVVVVDERGSAGGLCEKLRDAAGVENYSEVNQASPSTTVKTAAVTAAPKISSSTPGAHGPH
jgi:hypothetical protein